MRRIVFTFAVVVAFAGSAEAQPGHKDTPAAERTRTKLLKAKITFVFKGVSLRDCLKELAHQAEMEHGRPVMWTYMPDVDANQAVTYSCRNKPLDEVLADLFKSPGLGYVVVSGEEDKRDGWVRILKGDERGYSKTAPKKKDAAGDADEDEKLAASKLSTAKELIEGGKGATAKPLLQLIVKRYPKTKAGAEAKELLEKIDK